MVLKKAVQGCLYWFDGRRVGDLLVNLLCTFLFVVPVLPFIIYCQCWLYMADQMQLIDINEPHGVAFLGAVLFLFALPCVPWILLYGYVIIPNEPYVKFCKDGWKVGVTQNANRVRAVLSKETETWECPPKPGSTWVKQFPRAYSKGYEWQCNETYCTADELASPESCLSATVSLTVDGNYHGDFLRTCDNWSADNPGCCVNADYDRTYVECEYCIPDRGRAPLELLWAISTFAGIATFIPFFCWSQTVWAGLSWERDSRLAIEEKAKKEAEEKANKEAEEKAKKDAEAAEQGV